MSKYVMQAIDPAVDQLSNWLYTVCKEGPELDQAIDKLEEVKELVKRAIKDDDSTTRYKYRR